MTANTDIGQPTTRIDVLRAPSWPTGLLGYLAFAVGAGLANAFRSADLEEALVELAIATTSTPIWILFFGVFWFFGASRLLGGTATLATSIKEAGRALLWPWLVVILITLVSFGLLASGVSFVIAKGLVALSKIACGLYGYGLLIRAAHQVNSFTPLRTTLFAVSAPTAVIALAALVLLTR